MLGHLQENLLVLLAFDGERAPIIRGVVELHHYGGPYRIVAQRIYAHLDSFKKPPGDHLPDILSDKLEPKNDDAMLYEEIIEAIHLAKKGINAEYIMSQLEVFIKRQSLRSVAVDLTKALQRDTEQSLDEAEQLLASAHRQTISVFDPGTKLSDKKRALIFLDTTSSSFPTGIAELDKRGLGPNRKELWMLSANTKAGKSWALGQLAKMALMHRMKVLHVTLEMSEAKASQRYFQALFAIAKRKETVRITKFKKDTLGRISGFDEHKYLPPLTLDDPDIHKKLGKLIDKWAVRLLDNVYIKEFPTGHLTVMQLRAYLDNLETAQKFIPDLLIVDYPDLMKLGRDNFRLELDQVIKELRGIAVGRNIALAVVSQSNRSSVKSKQVGVEHTAEAYSKVAHSDVFITYTQTQQEHKLGLARLYVAAGRNEEDKFTVYISQSYATGQFVISSATRKGTYWQNLPNDDTP